MDKIRIEQPLLALDINTFESQVEQFSNNWEKTVNAMNELSATWEGPSHETFMQAFQEDIELMDELIHILNEMKDAMSYAEYQYAKCDSDVVSIVNGIKV